MSANVPPPRVIKPICAARVPATVVQLEHLWMQLPAERKQEITQRLTWMVAQRLSQPSLGKEVGDE